MAKTIVHNKPLERTKSVFVVMKSEKRSLLNSAIGWLKTRRITSTRIHIEGARVNIFSSLQRVKGETHKLSPLEDIGEAVKTLARSFLLACLIIYLSPLRIPEASAASQKKSVLVLFPYQIDLPNHKICLQAIQEEFHKVGDLELEMHYEYLELNRFPDPIYQAQMFALLAAKYHDRSIDLVILQTEVLLKLWLVQRREVLPDTPVVFYSTNMASVAKLSLPQDVIGVSDRVDFTQSINWILRARPSVNEIVLVYGPGPLEHEYIQPVEQLQTALGERVRITDLSDQPFDEIMQRVANLPRTAVILYTLMFEDAAGVQHRPIDVIQELAAVSPVPIISGYDQYLGSGDIGGYMFSSEQQARDAVQMSLRILRGEAVSTIPSQKGQSNRFIFDHLVLRRFDIPLSDLPPGSIIKNRQYSVWELYWPQIITMITIIATLSLMVISLLFVTRKLNRTRLALADLNLNLESQVQERTATLRQTNVLLQDEINERVRLEDELRYQATTDTLTGISNRRYFLESAQNEMNRARRFGHPLAIALLDIDHFKSINDTYGHAAGDQALLVFVTTCQQNLRDIDVFARLGGDEFVILLPETDCDQAYTALECFRKDLTAVPFDFAGQSVQITSSIGISNLANENESLNAFLKRADEALYQAKEAGRNQIAIVHVS